MNEAELSQSLDRIFFYECRFICTRNASQYISTWRSRWIARDKNDDLIIADVRVSVRVCRVFVVRNTFNYYLNATKSWSIRWIVWPVSDDGILCRSYGHLTHDRWFSDILSIRICVCTHAFICIHSRRLCWCDDEWLCIYSALWYKKNMEIRNFWKFKDDTEFVWH